MGCMENEEETKEYSGIIGKKKLMGYEYTIMKREACSHLDHRI